MEKILEEFIPKGKRMNTIEKRNFDNRKINPIKKNLKKEMIKCEFLELP